MTRRQWGNLIVTIGMLMLAAGLCLHFLGWRPRGTVSGVPGFDDMLWTNVHTTLAVVGGLTMVAGTMIRLGKKSTLCPHCGVQNDIRVLVCRKCGKQIGQE